MAGQEWCVPVKYVTKLSQKKRVAAKKGESDLTSNSIFCS